MTYIAKRVLIKHSDVEIGVTNSINFLDGNNATFTVFDDVPNEHIDVQVESTGGGGLPTQTGNNGKFLTTDGSVASWATVSRSGLTQQQVEGLI